MRPWRSGLREVMPSCFEGREEWRGGEGMELKLVITEVNRRGLEEIVNTN